MRPEAAYLEDEWKRVRNYIPDPKDRDVMDRYVHYKAQQYTSSYERWSTALYASCITFIAGLVIIAVVFIGATVRRSEIEEPLKTELRVKEEQMRRVSEKCIDKIICDCSSNEQ